MESHLTEIKKSVSFVFVPDGAGGLRPQGTGFFVGVKNELNPNVSNIYFVTAKHVLQDQQDNYFPEIVIRLNTRKGDSQLIQLLTKDIKMFEHIDKDVDIVVFSCLPDIHLYDFKFIPNELIAHNELISTHAIEEGDDVFFTGLFLSHMGQKRNHPIIRFGKVALMPEEKIEWKEQGKPPKVVDLYLLECQSFTGNSGSPVFFQLQALRKRRQPALGGQVFLAGVMKGSFLHGNEVQPSETSAKLILWQNAGIAAVTPANKLHDILYSDEMVRQRRGDESHLPPMS